MGDQSRTQTRGFLFADLRGYTAFTDQHGDVAASALLDRYRVLVRREVARFDGAEIRTEGDGFYIVFPSASSAVRCGLAIVAEAAREKATTTEEPLRVAVGIHAGETAESGEEYVGAAINVAARVCSVAREGEVLVTETVRSLTRTLLPGQFVPRGSPRLKGVAEPIPLYRVEATAAAAATRGAARPRARMAAAVVVSMVGIAGLVVAALAWSLGGAGDPGSSTGLGPALSPPPGSAAAQGSAGAPRPTSTQMVSTEPALTLEQRDLLERIPGRVQETCVTESSDTNGVVARLRCPLALGADADTAWYERFETSQLMTLALDETEASETLPPGACADGEPGSGEWSTPADTFSGRLMCYSLSGGAWIVWSYDNELIVASATRSDGNTVGLYEWWRTVGPFLR